ncbi:hypothetical protein INT45_006368 [Circinella minor]|uniref:Thc1 RRM domain-containing protein n=1 Tax=Circinella minor TaxID=1195481 RepID=A0A8H7SD55_9FUNG|nr:hypothetical protein INT45_006368 [Circinella minor]
MSKPENGRRQPMQIYVPRHRRVVQQQHQQDLETTLTTTMNGRLNNNLNYEQQSRMSRENTSSSPVEVIRRGRGQFRAPISANNNNNSDNHWNDIIDSNNSKNNNYNNNSKETLPFSSLPSSSIQTHYNRPTPPSSPSFLNNNTQEQEQKELSFNDSINSVKNNNNRSNVIKYNNSMDQLTTTMENLNIVTLKEDSHFESDDGSLEKEEWEDLLETLDKEDESFEKQQPSDEKSLKNNVSIIIPEKKSRNIQSSSPPSQSSINNNTHILDCFGFPSSFKTYHLQSIFSKYDHVQGGYRIKWMDDTRALIIFAHSQTAKRAYLDSMNNPQIKIRPYTDGIECSESQEEQPIPRRPATTDMVARRLINGALGVRGPTRTPEQREKERALLQAERDRREAIKRKEAERSKAISDAFNE